eukprot:scaffold292662_cov22-Tisochrysis_lutea.AAC.1
MADLLGSHTRKAVETEVTAPWLPPSRTASLRFARARTLSSGHCSLRGAATRWDCTAQIGHPGPTQGGRASLRSRESFPPPRLRRGVERAATDSR